MREPERRMISVPFAMRGATKWETWRRPRSASSFASNGSCGREAKARPKSWERFGPSGEEEKGESDAKMLLGGRREGRCPCCLSDLDWRRSSTRSFHNFEEDPWTHFQFLSRNQGKPVSKPNFSNLNFQKGKVPDSERPLHKVKRSLRLLGFEPSELGICCGGAKTAAKWKRESRTPTFSTRIVRRSVSLDSLRAVIRKAWLDDRVGKRVRGTRLVIRARPKLSEIPDESHRSLLARAAYEEWYFAKERELRQKREEERKAREIAKESLQEDFQKKKQKSEEEFQKWLYKKRWKKDEGSGSRPQKNYEPSVKLAKTKDELEEAFAKWKMTKDKELRRKKTERRREEEKRAESEKQKAERKAVAEKAFQQWKSKLEENERRINRKMQMKKMRQEAQEKRKTEEKRKISFQMWKAAKDKEIKQRIKEFREAERTAREERLTQLEERMYEAEQAFEDWLERVDMRRKKQCCPASNYRKSLPWLPA